jgi:GNAT superfamily N-acetyltransferase
MLPQLTVTPARAEDAPAFIALRGRTRENAVSVSRLASLGITAASWADAMHRGELTGFCAHQGEELLGYGFGDTRTGAVVVLALLPHAEGRGWGRRLLAQVVLALRSAGHQRLFLACSADPTVRSHGFYRHLGWQPTGEVDAWGDERLELWPDASTSSAPASVPASARAGRPS